MENMKTYIGVKIIEAKPMKLGEYKRLSGHALEAFEDPEKDGYVVRYPDGYMSWSPKDVFDEAYREKNGLTFGLAIEAMKKGHKVARAGWNGKGMFVYMVDGQTVERCRLKGAAHYHYPHIESGLTAETPVKICPHIDMKAADGSIVVGWLASQTDMLSEDWMVIE